LGSAAAAGAVAAPACRPGGTDLSGAIIWPLKNYIQISPYEKQMWGGERRIYEEAFAALQAKFTFLKRAESYLNCR